MWRTWHDGKALLWPETHIFHHGYEQEGHGDHGAAATNGDGHGDAHADAAAAHDNAPAAPAEAAAPKSNKSKSTH